MIAPTDHEIILIVPASNRIEWIVFHGKPDGSVETLHRSDTRESAVMYGRAAARLLGVKVIDDSNLSNVGSISYNELRARLKIVGITL